MNLLRKTSDHINKHKLIQRGQTVVIGVSGGADSVCLLYLLNQLKHKLGIQLHIAHYNHRLRPNSYKDEEFVKELASKFNISITIERRKGAIKSKLVSEDQSRKWRYHFFARIARKVKANSIVLAHTENDLAETVLMRLLRGTGLLGLKGILNDQKLLGVRVVRPLLTVNRLEIENYLKEKKQAYCTDETNLKTFYLRNKIRLKLLPMIIKEYNPNFSGVLLDLSHTVACDYEWLLSQSRRLFIKLASVSQRKVSFQWKDFSKQHLSMQRMLLRLSYEHLTSDLNQLSFKHIQEVEEMLLSRPEGSVVHWPRSIKVLNIKERIVLSF